jgi:hypothetical protein
MQSPVLRLVSVLVVALIAAFALAAPADAGSRELKNTGTVGERADGYLGIVSSAAGPDVSAEVDSINAARRAAYLQAASDTERPLVEIEAVAGARLREKAVPGDWIQNAAGAWVQKQ